MADIKLPPLLTLRRGLTLRCGVCGSRGMIRGWFRMVEQCPRCGLRPQRLAGHSTGAIGTNTIVTFTLLFFFVLGSALATMPDVPVGPLLVVGVSMAIVFPLLFHPFSHTVFLALDLVARPPGLDEFDAGADGVHLVRTDRP